MILGRTSENLIKIKKDDPLGLRAVNCACCVTCGCFSTKLTGAALATMLAVIARGYFLTFTFNGLEFDYANITNDSVEVLGWPDWPTENPDIQLQAGIFYFNTVDNCMSFECTKQYMPTEDILGDFRFGRATPECDCTSEDDQCFEHIVTINGQEFKGQIYNGYGTYPFLPFPIELMYT